jgi:hypothetical protein
MDAKLGGPEILHPQLSGKVCWKKIVLLVMEILNVKVRYLFSSDLMLSPQLPN